jgi:hypothetical protein
LTFELAPANIRLRGGNTKQLILKNPLIILDLLECADHATSVQDVENEFPMLDELVRNLSEVHEKRGIKCVAVAEKRTKRQKA